MVPKGTILIIGGAEDKGNGDTPMQKETRQFEQFAILKKLLPQNDERKRIEIITTASSVQGEVEKMYKAAFRKMNFTDVGFLNVSDKEEARTSACCERIEKAHAVFFSGGDQFKLSAILGGTEIVRSIRNKYFHDKDFVVGGTSAGAMAMSKIMIFEGGDNEAILKDDLKIASGLGIFDTCIIDTHFIKRGRFGRLAHAVIMNPESLGIGLGEDTALIIKKGTQAECDGSGMVVIIDGNEINQTNITDAEDGMPVYVDNLKVHLLVKNSRFSISDRKMWIPEKRGRKS